MKKQKESQEEIDKIADFFKAFGDATRIKIILAIKDEEKCVKDISEKCNMEISAISHQLSTLKKKNIVKSRKLGKEVLYTISDDHIKDLVESTLIHVNEEDEKWTKKLKRI